jgi:hypothetical protein
LVWDVTCVDTLADCHIIGSITSVGSVAAGAERKMTINFRNLVEGRFIFSPLAFETFGPWGPESKALIWTIGQKITEKTGNERATEFLRQRISIEIQQENAASILNTYSDTRGLDEIFYVLNVKR